MSEIKIPVEGVNCTIEELECNLEEGNTGFTSSCYLLESLIFIAKQLEQAQHTTDKDLIADNQRLTTENQTLLNQAEDAKELVNKLNWTISELRAEIEQLAAENKRMDDEISDQSKIIQGYDRELQKENIQNKIYMKLIHEGGNDNLKSIMADIVKLGGLRVD